MLFTAIKNCILLQIFFLAIFDQNKKMVETACPSYICQSVRCAAPAAECLTDPTVMAAEHYYLAQHGTGCGCCPICVKLLRKRLCYCYVVYNILYY